MLIMIHLHTRTLHAIVFCFVNHDAFFQNLVGHLSSGSSLSIASAQPCQKSKVGE